MVRALADGLSPWRGRTAVRPGLARLRGELPPGDRNARGRGDALAPGRRPSPARRDGPGNPGLAAAPRAHAPPLSAARGERAGAPAVRRTGQRRGDRDGALACGPER